MNLRQQKLKEDKRLKLQIEDDMQLQQLYQSSQSNKINQKQQHNYQVQPKQQDLFGLNIIRNNIKHIQEQNHVDEIYSNRIELQQQSIQQQQQQQFLLQPQQKLQQQQQQILQQQQQQQWQQQQNKQSQFEKPDIKMTKRNKYIQTKCFDNYSQQELEKLPSYDLYVHFKDMESCLKEIFQIKDSDKQIMLKGIEIFMICSKYLIFEDINFATIKKIDMRFWFILRSYIGLSKNAQDYDEQNILYLIQFLKQMIEELKNKISHIILSEVQFSNNIRRFMANIFAYLGELMEYKQKYLKLSSSNLNISEIMQNYYESINLYPFEGKFYMLLASCSKLKHDIFGAIYYGIRAQLADIPFQTQDKVMEFLKKTKIFYEQEQHRNDLQQNALKMFTLSVLRFVSILINKEDQQILKQVGCDQIRFFNQLIQNKDFILNDVRLFDQIILMILFSIFNTIEGWGFISNVSLYQKIKQRNQIISQTLNIECIQYQGQILFMILNFLRNSLDNEKHIDTMMPIIYYLYEYDQQFQCIMMECQDGLQILNKFCQDLEQLFQSSQDQQIQIEDVIQNSIFESDIKIIGFLPFKSFFVKMKKNFQVCNENNILKCKQYMLLKLVRLLLKNCQHIQQTYNQNDEQEKLEQKINSDQIQENEQKQYLQQQKFQKHHYKSKKKYHENFQQQYQKKMSARQQRNVDDDDYKRDQFQIQKDEIDNNQLNYNVENYLQKQRLENLKQNSNLNNVEESYQTEELSLQLKLKRKQSSESSDNNYEEQEEDLNDFLQNQSLPQDLQNFKLSNTESKKSVQKISKQIVLLDGQNVALRMNQKQFSSSALQIAANYWTKRGHQLYILLPDYLLNEKEILRRKETNQEIKKIPDDIPLLLKLKDQGLISGIPNWVYDDSFIIDFARRKNAFIVTNDRYNDYIQNYSQNDDDKKDELKNWVRNHCISFAFIGEEFCPDPNIIALKQL